jgi:deoxyribodipyrimidine photolyase-related protein
MVDGLQPDAIECVHPGEWRVLRALRQAAAACNVPLTIHEDKHFLVSRDAFDGWMAGRRTAIMEHFYRWQRKELDVLMEADGSPVGGAWNFDKENRAALRSAPDVRRPYQPRMDGLTRATAEMIERRFPESPGSLERFRWPVTRDQALRALRDFVEHRLPYFGSYQDAMWDGEPFLYHSLLSTALNLKLLRPMECVDAAVTAYESGAAPINAVEGFVRQIIGWREFIRGIYWHEGPEYPQRNGLSETGSLPQFYWTGETDMACMRDSIGQVLSCGYGHHIQRLMVTGNFALIAGVEPQLVNDWYRGMYVDAVDWATTPNVIGMVMHADGGVVGTKPYAASGQYIKRMSNYCAGCRYDPTKRTGGSACPFTTFYWDFLLRHEDTLRANQRMSLIMKNVDRIDAPERTAINERAAELRASLGVDR